MFPDNSKQRYGLRRHFTAFVLVLAGTVAVCGCAQLAPRTSTRHAAIPQPLARLDLPTDTADARASALMLGAEFALQGGDTPKAAHEYAAAAALSTDPKVAQHALQLALAAGDAASAQRLVARWRVLGANARQLAGARARVAMLRGDRAEAERQFGSMLAPGDVAAWPTFVADLLAARDRALAGRVLAALAVPARLPAAEDIWVALSQLGEHLGQHAFAAQLATAAVRRFGGPDSIRWAASLRLGVKDRTGALALYAAGVKAHPHNVDLRLGYAALLASSGADRTALAVLATGPQTRATWAARVAYAAHAKDTTALRQLYAALQRAPAAQRAGSQFLLGQLAESLQHDQQALRWYAKVDPAGRDAFEARVRSAVLLDKAGHHGEAHTLAEQLEQDYADDPARLRTAYELDAQMYSRDRQSASAIATYNRALAALPGDPALLYDRGVEQANAGRLDAALADFRQVLKLQPDSVEAMNALGFTLADANRDLPEATKLLQRALAAKPDVAAILDSWGWLQYRLGHFGEAERYLRRAWEQGADPDVGVHFGKVLWQLGRHQQAREVFAKVRKLDPTNSALLCLPKGWLP